MPAILALILIALAVRTFLYQPFSSPSESMTPTISEGEKFLATKYAFRGHGPERGDVVVFYVPERGSYFVKRIVGLPGDKIAMENGFLLVNGVAVTHHRAEPVAVSCSLGTCPSSQYDETLPGGRHYRILELARDSPLDNTQAFPVPRDRYFVLGDNRRNSDDSRSDLGFVPRAEIVGRVDFKFFSHGGWTWETVQ